MLRPAWCNGFCQSHEPITARFWLSLSWCALCISLLRVWTISVRVPGYAGTRQSVYIKCWLSRRWWYTWWVYETINHLVPGSIPAAVKLFSIFSLSPPRDQFLFNLRDHFWVRIISHLHEQYSPLRIFRKSLSNDSCTHFAWVATSKFLHVSRDADRIVIQWYTHSFLSANESSEVVSSRAQGNRMGNTRLEWTCVKNFSFTLFCRAVCVSIAKSCGIYCTTKKFLDLLFYTCGCFKKWD